MNLELLFNNRSSLNFSFSGLRAFFFGLLTPFSFFFGSRSSCFLPICSLSLILWGVWMDRLIDLNIRNIIDRGSSYRSYTLGFKESFLFSFEFSLALLEAEVIELFDDLSSSFGCLIFLRFHFHCILVVRTVFGCRFLNGLGKFSHVILIVFQQNVE